MKLFYERCDTFPGFPYLRSASSARCSFCNYLSSIVEEVINEELEGKTLETKPMGRFLGSVLSHAVKTSHWQFWVPKSEADGILPCLLEGKISSGTVKKDLRFSASMKGCELMCCVLLIVVILSFNNRTRKFPRFSNLRPTLRKGIR